MEQANTQINQNNPFSNPEGGIETEIGSNNKANGNIDLFAAINRYSRRQYDPKNGWIYFRNGSTTDECAFLQESDFVPWQSED